MPEIKKLALCMVISFPHGGSDVWVLCESDREMQVRARSQDP